MKRIILAIAALLGLATPAAAQTETFTNFVRSAPVGVATTTSIIPCINTNGSTYATYQCTPPSLLSLLTSPEVIAALGYTPMNGANNLSELTDTSTARINLGVTGSASGIVDVLGTANQITATNVASTVTLSLPATVIAPGSLAATTTVSGPNFILGQTPGPQFVLGQSAPMTVWSSASASPTAQILANNIGLGIARFSSTSGNSAGSTILLNRSKSDSVGVLATVAQGDRLASLNIRGANATSWLLGAQLSATVSGAVPTSGAFLPGNIELQTSNGATNPATGLFIGPNQEVVQHPEAALSTAASVGYFYLSTMAGVPIGTPASFSNNAPLVIDSSGDNLYWYTNGAWHAPTGGGGGGGVASVVGTVNQIKATTVASNVTLALPTSVDFPGSLTTTGISSTGTISGTAFIPAVNATTPQFSFFSPAPNEVALSVTSSQELRIDSSGRTLVNLTQAISNNGTFGQLEVASADKRNLSLQRYAFGTASSNAATLDFMRSRSTIIGQTTALALGDAIGVLRFAGVRTDGAFDNAANITVSVGNSPTASAITGTIDFNTVDGVAALKRLEIDYLGNVAVGGLTAQLGTTVSNGFLYIPNMAGTPTGTPSTINPSFTSPITVDATNNLLYFYSSGAWHSSSGSGVTSVSGTVNQINSTGGTTPVLSLPNSVQFPGSITTTGGISSTTTVSGTAFIPAVGAVPAYGFFSSAPNTLAISVGSSQAFTVTSAAQTLVNTTISLSKTTGAVFTPVEAQEVISADAKRNTFLARFNATAAQGPDLSFLRSKSGTNGTYTAVSSGDTLGNIFFSGVDSVGKMVNGAAINSLVDSTVTTNNMPGALLFQTSDAGGTLATFARGDHLQNFISGNLAALSTSTSNGFFYLGTMAGTPTGTPTTVTQTVGSAQVVDSTNNIPYFWSNSAWHGIGALNVASIWTAGQSGRVSSLTDAATISIDMASGNNFESTLHGSRTLANPTNAISGQSGIIQFTQDSSGSRVLSFGSNYVSTTIPVLTTTAGATDYLTYYVQSPTKVYVSAINNVK